MPCSSSSGSAPVLVANGLLTEGGVSVFAIMCAVHGKLVQMWAAGQSPNGALLAAYRGLANDFGLTPVAQSKVSPVGDRGPTDSTVSATTGGGREWAYGYRWQKSREAFLREHPLCRMCESRTPPRLTLGTVVDHIIPHKGDAAKFWDQSGLESLCKRCHDSASKARTAPARSSRRSGLMAIPSSDGRRHRDHGQKRSLDRRRLFTELNRNFPAFFWQQIQRDRRRAKRPNG